MNTYEETMQPADADRLRKQIMKSVQTRWLLTKKLPQVVVELGMITLLVLMSRPRIFFSAVFENALQASSNPLSFAEYFMRAYAHTTPGVKMLFAAMLVIGIVMVRDVLAARRFSNALR